MYHLIVRLTLAKNGFRLDDHQAGSINSVLAAGRDMPELQRVFARPDGRAWSPGDRLVQPDLAKTLRLIAEQGAEMDGGHLPALARPRELVERLEAYRIALLPSGAWAT